MAVVKTSTLYLVILFIVISGVLLMMLPSSNDREGMKTRRTPPLSADASMKQVKEGTKTMGHDGYVQSISNRIGKLEQTYPDIPDDS
uniref:Uncharacterized protein n=1 Tax=viral metagenome TaxID=1070528 RepID=A0A6C0CII9_9ZZZZ